MSTFDKHTREQHTNLIANCLPNDRVWDAKNINETNLRNLLQGHSGVLRDIEANIIALFDEYDPTTTLQLVEQWESALSIPDDCIPIFDTIEARRNMILLKLTALGVQTAEEFVALAARLGYDVEIIAGHDFFSFTYTFPIVFANSAQEARYTMVVKLALEFMPIRFTYFFPILFTEGDQTNIIECLFKKLAPSNVRVVFFYS